MERLLKKHRHRAHPGAGADACAPAKQPTRLGAIYFGSTSPAMNEADEMLAEQGIAPRPAAGARLPVRRRGGGLHRRHDQVFVVEQNRDGQLRMLLVNELEIDPAKLVQGAALRRHADHRPLHRRRDRRPAGRADKSFRFAEAVP